MWRSGASLALLLGIVGAAERLEAQVPEYHRRWFYSMVNLQVDSNADELIGLIERGARAGYNGVVLADYKLNVLDRVTERYFANLERVKKAAQAKGLEIIPAVFPIGYSNGLLAHDANLAEGMPATAIFRVVGGIATLVRTSE